MFAWTICIFAQMEGKAKAPEQTGWKHKRKNGKAWMEMRKFETSLSSRQLRSLLPTHRRRQTLVRMRERAFGLARWRLQDKSSYQEFAISWEIARVPPLTENDITARLHERSCSRFTILPPHKLIVFSSVIRRDFARATFNLSVTKEKWINSSYNKMCLIWLLVVMNCAFEALCHLS